MCFSCVTHIDQTQTITYYGMMPDLPPILFLHGLATTSKRTWGDNGWFDLVYEAKRQAQAIDLPGHGEEYNSESDFSGSYLDFIESRITTETVDAVAFSLGARIVLKLAIKNPSRFRKIVVAGVGDSLFEPDEEHGRKIFNAISGTGVDEDPESHYFSQLAVHPDIDGPYIAACLQMQDLSLSPQDLSKLQLPVLVVLGDKDFAGPATKLIEALPYADLVTLKGVDHFATPKDFNFIENALKFIDAEPNW